jgi:tetratricopeptide (TPR) repeat protein
MAESVGDQRRLGGAYSQLSTALWMASDHEQALMFARKALALAEASNIFALRKAALHNYAMIHHAMAEYGVAIETWRGLAGEFSGELERKRFGWAGFPSVLCRMFLGSSLTLIGDFAPALDAFADGIRIADAVDDPYSMAIVREELGYCHLSMGRPEAALDALEAAMRICRDRQVYTMYPAIAGRLAATLAECGRADEAIALAEDALARETHRLGGRYAHDFLLLGLGAAYLEAGRCKDALETAGRAEALTGAAREHGYHGCALLLLGQTYAEHGAGYAAAAERAFEQSLATALRHGMRPLAAQCRHALGALHAREGRQDAAAAALRDAARGYAELGLPELESRVLALL